MNSRQVILLTARYVAIASAMFAVLTSVFLWTNYLHMKNSNPGTMKILLEMREKAITNPIQNDNADKFREIDLLARKNYLSDIISAEKGAYLLLFSIALFMASITAIVFLRDDRPVPTDTDEGRREFSEQKKSRRILLAALIALVAFSFIIAKKAGENGAEEKGSLAKENPEAKSETKISNSEKFPELQEQKRNWPAFRGSLSSAISENPTPSPKHWNGNTGENILWKKNVPKAGNSSPVIWADRLFLTGADTTERKIFCFSTETGEIIWTGDVKAGEDRSKDLNLFVDTGYAPSTVATDGRYVCATFANGDMACFDFQGSLLWAKNIGFPDNPYGYASSPIIFENKVIIQYDNNNLHFVAAYNLADGREVWKTERDVNPCWSSPTLAVTGKTTLLVLCGNPFTACYDPLDGKELWRNKCLFNDLAISPAYCGDTIILPSEYNEMAAFSSDGKNVLWKTSDIMQDVPTPLAAGNFVIFVASSGAVSCHSISTGEKLWEQSFPEGFYSSPVTAGGVVYLMDRKGTTQIFELKGEYSPLPSAELGEKCDTTPAFARDRIYIRGADNLYCIGKKEK